MNKVLRAFAVTGIVAVVAEVVGLDAALWQIIATLTLALLVEHLDTRGRL
jgi:hypothetical protein